MGFTIYSIKEKYPKTCLKIYFKRVMRKINPL